MRKAAQLSFLLLTRPGRGVQAVLADPPSLRGLVLFLGMAGFLRGFLEIFWLIGMNYKPGLIHWLLQDPSARLIESALFITANVLTAYLRWGICALVFLWITRWFGARVPFSQLSEIAGLLLGLCVVPVVINVLYLFFPLPILKFSVAQVYQPVVGMGTLLSAVWFGVAAYRVFRAVCGFSVGEAVLAAAFVPLLDRVLFVSAAAALFQVRWLAWLPAAQRMMLVTVGFIGVALVATPLLLWLGRRWDRARGSFP